MEIIPVFHYTKTQTHPVEFKFGMWEFRLWHHKITKYFMSHICEPASV